MVLFSVSYIEDEVRGIFHGNIQVVLNTTLKKVQVEASKPIKYFSHNRKNSVVVTTTLILSVVARVATTRGDSDTGML